MKQEPPVVYNIYHINRVIPTFVLNHDQIKNDINL